MRRLSVVFTGLAAIAVATASGAASAAPSPDLFTRAVGLTKLNAANTYFDAGQRFTLDSTVSDADGVRHVRMHRYQDGLPVLGGDLVVHIGADNAWRGVSQSLAAAPKPAAKATLSAAQAGTAALRVASAGELSVAGTQLVIDAGVGAPRLAYEVVVSGVYSDATPSRLHVLVDAASGRIRDSWETIHNADTGTGNGFHNGTVAIGTTAAAGTFQLSDASRGAHRTYNLNHATTGTGTLFTSATNVFGDGTNATAATAGADVHYGAAKTWDYFLNIHGRNGIRNNGVGAYSRVHYSTNYVNAFWDDVCFCMTYGDGNLSQGWYPLTSLDVAGHEMSHGVTSNTANLRYSGESGGLNEATSDIFGTMVEFYANNPNDAPDYKIGEKLRTNGTSLRYMYNPSLDGLSANCWSSTVKNLDVHYSSGVGNHFFFLLAVGSGNTAYGTSPTCNGSAVTGIGNAKAEKIWYRALTTYMTSRTNYKGARTATLSAAADLYGASSVEYSTVAAAWSAVSVV